MINLQDLTEIGFGAKDRRANCSFSAPWVRRRRHSSPPTTSRNVLPLFSVNTYNSLGRLPQTATGATRCYRDLYQVYTQVYLVSDLPVTSAE